MKRIVPFIVICISSSFSFSQSSNSSFDAYINASNDNVFDEIANSQDGVDRPNDLDFNKEETNGPSELWVINEGTENSGGSTVTIINAGKTGQTSRYEKDGNAWHFMSLPTALAFGENGTWASSPGVFDANHSGGSPFTGPTLWASDLLVYAVTPPGGNGSHLDMLHQSPYAMGIAHQKDNIYWVNDGFHSTIVMYDFVQDHGPGNSYHDDGRVHFYSEISVKRDVTGIPGHLVLDKATDWLYICDTGNKRILRMKVNSATKKADLTPQYETLAQRWEMQNLTWEVAATSNLSKPCGIDIFGDRLVVTDNGTNEIIIYDISSSPITEIGRVTPPFVNKNIRGVKVDNQGDIYFVNYGNSKVFRLSNKAVVGIEETNTAVSINLYPNPARDVITLEGLNNTSSARLSISDSQGRTVKSTSVKNVNGPVQIDISILQNGIYFMLVETESGDIASKKFIVQ